MGANPRIATCSGKAYLEDENGRLVLRNMPTMCRLGRRNFTACLVSRRSVGLCAKLCGTESTVIAAGCIGWIACSWDEPELRFIHLRPEGSSQKSIYAGRVRHGYGQYFMGTGFLFIVASSIYRLNRKPYVLGSVAMLWGWLKAALLASRVTTTSSSERFFVDISGVHFGSARNAQSRRFTATGEIA